jgi:DNA (cytosine-5)-methyltransferase 1
MQAGWKGLFAIEKDSHAFSTLKANLVERKRGPSFEWPGWLEKEPHEIGELTRKYKANLLSLRGKVDLIVGGPPCQGFSSAGRRDPDDPRNQLFKQYLRVVGLVQPKMLLLENVRGISIEFADKKVRKRRGGKSSRAAEPFSETIRRRLERRGYTTFPVLLRSADYGVPQLRPRYFMMGVRRGTAPRPGDIENPFNTAPRLRQKFLERLGLTEQKRVGVRDAISDLRTKGTILMDCVDSRGFNQIVYRGPRTPYQVQMHGSMNGHAPNSLRLPNHSAEIVARFEKMVKTARKGVSLSDKERKKFGVKKQSIVVLKGTAPSHTLTTLPDDYVHYSEGRILTVREYARLQSFPDWFEFRGAYTTGGERRIKTCPRYTQVGNAVPPRLATFLGTLIRSYAKKSRLSHVRG